MALGSFSLSLLIQVHEAAAVVESGGDAGVEWRPPSGSVGQMGTWAAAVSSRETGHPQGWKQDTASACPTRRYDGYSLSKSIYDLRTSTRALIRVRRASLGPQGRVPPGVHGEAR